MPPPLPPPQPVPEVSIRGIINVSNIARWIILMTRIIEAAPILRLYRFEFCGYYNIITELFQSLGAIAAHGKKKGRTILPFFTVSLKLQGYFSELSII
jgi:hypothetical protein